MAEKGNIKLRILHLARWFPNRYDPMPGLFIRRHAESAALMNDVVVVYTHFVDQESQMKSVYEMDYEVLNRVPTAKVYYRSSKCKITPLRKLVNLFRFYKANYIGIKKVKKTLGGIDLIHIHILTRLGVIGLYYKMIYRVPYVVTEHWSRYLELTGSFRGLYRKLLTKIVVQNASCVTAVTNNLALAMQSHGLRNDNYLVLPNVVDDIFLENIKINKPNNSKTVFLHVSCFEDKSKNISGLLRVIENMARTRNDFKFRMIGDGKDMGWLQDYASKLGLTNDIIEFKGMLEGESLVNEMATADMLVVFSNYENFPVVINESLSMGIPVIATRVGGIPERINARNGILVDSAKEDQLEAGLTNFLEKRITFDMEAVRKESIDEFSPEAISFKLNDIYHTS
jgi:L-malate glycosyltransferase